MKETKILTQKKYFFIAIAIFLLSFTGQVLFVAFDNSGWANLFMIPFTFLHSLFLILFLILYKKKYLIAFLFPVLVLLEGFMFIVDADFFEQIMPSYLIFSLIFNLIY